jgi:hypothetical protein
VSFNETLFKGALRLVSIHFFRAFVCDRSVFTLETRPAREIMRSVTIWIPAVEFSGTMTAIAEWLDDNRHKPTRYKYDHNEDAVLVTLDFPAEVAAEAFAARFDGVYHASTQAASLDRSRQLPTGPSSL